MNGNGEGVQVAPSVLAADFSRLGEEIESVEKAGADSLHLDVMDGHFVPNISFGIPVLKSIRPLTKLSFDTHLMLSRPWDLLEAFRDAGADSITIHLEVCEDPNTVLEEIRSLGMACGLSVNPSTPVEALLPFLHALDLALVMSVEPGFGGQSFKPEVLSKVETVREFCSREKLSPVLQVDGGVTPENAPSCRQAGATNLVAGSSVFGAPDRAAVIRALRG